MRLTFCALHLTTTSILAVLFSATCGAQDLRAEFVAVEETGCHTGNYVECVLDVKSAYHLKRGPFIFLNSRTNHQEATNFAVVVKDEAYRELVTEIFQDPSTYFAGRRVRIKGVVSLYQGRPEIIVTERNQLQLISSSRVFSQAN